MAKKRPRRRWWVWALVIAALLAVPLFITLRTPTPSKEEEACREAKERLAFRVGNWVPGSTLPDLSKCPPNDPDVLRLRGDFERVEREGLATMEGALQKRFDAAEKVWRAYDELPADKRTRDALMAAVAEAKTHERGLWDPSRIKAYNGRSARMRMAWIINPASLASGDEKDVLIPSLEKAKCLVWGSQWAAEGESLKILGFTKIQCGLGTDWAKEWVIP